MSEEKWKKIPKEIDLNGNKFHHAVGFSWKDFNEVVEEQGNYNGFIIFVDDDIAEYLLKSNEWLYE